MLGTGLRSGADPSSEVVRPGVVIVVSSANKSGLEQVKQERFRVVILPNIPRDIEIAREGDPVSKIVGLPKGGSVAVGDLVFTVEEILDKLG